MSFARNLLLPMLLSAWCSWLPAQAPPAWVQGQGQDPAAYPAARFLTGYGLSSPGGDQAEQRRQAVAMAQEALASAIRTHISSEFTSRVTQKDQHMTRYAQNLVRTHADLDLQGVDTVLSWHDPKGNVTHALAVLDKPRTVHLLDGQLQRQAAECATAFDRGRAANDPAGLLQARHLREALEETLVVRAVLAPEPPPAVAAPAAADITAELRRVYGSRAGLDRYVALAALDLDNDLPKGIRVLMDRITFADTPFCGTLSAWLEQSLAAQLASSGQVRILDKGQGLQALRASAMEGGLGGALEAQAAVRGVVLDLGEEVVVTLRAISATGEELAAAKVVLPAQLVRRAGLKLVPDNYQEARKALEICDAQVQASKLQVKVALDRGDGGIYRRGEKLHLFVKANMDCYLKVLYHQVDGTKVLVFPNKYHTEARIQRDRLYQIPPDDNSFDLEVTPPFGAELVKVIACTDPIDVPTEAPDPSSGLAVVRQELGSLLVTSRSIVVKKAEAQYGEATAVVNTMEAAAKAN